MKIFTIGSTGRVGRALLDQLSKTEHTVLAGARHPESLPPYQNVQPIAFDLSQTPQEMAEKLAGCDAIIDVAGSAGTNLLQIDLFGAVNLMRAAKIAGVKRFIMLSTVFALQPEKWTSPEIISLKDYYIAKHFADLYLTENSGLDYTILQPGLLSEKAGTGQITLNDNQSQPARIEDVAQTLAETVNHPNTIGKVLSMHTGTSPVATALSHV